MLLSRDIEGKPIISVSDGRIIGRVKDVYLDPQLNHLAGLHIGREGLIKRKSLLIQRKDIVLFGVDVVLVSGSDVITDDRQLVEAKMWLRQDTLNGRQVDTPGGTKLGVIGDVTLDEVGTITGFALSRVHVEGPLAETGFVPHESVLDMGSEDGIMTIDLAKLEAIHAGQPAQGEETSETAGDESAEASDEVPGIAIVEAGETSSDAVEIEERETAEVVQVSLSEMEEEQPPAEETEDAGDQVRESDTETPDETG